MFYKIIFKSRCAGMRKVLFIIDCALPYWQDLFMLTVKILYMPQGKTPRMLLKQSDRICLSFHRPRDVQFKFQCFGICLRKKELVWNFTFYGFKLPVVIVVS